MKNLEDILEEIVSEILDEIGDSGSYVEPFTAINVEEPEEPEEDDDELEEISSLDGNEFGSAELSKKKKIDDLTDYDGMELDKDNLKSLKQYIDELNATSTTGDMSYMTPHAFKKSKGKSKKKSGEGGGHKKPEVSGYTKLPISRRNFESEFKNFAKVLFLTERVDKKVEKQILAAFKKLLPSKCPVRHVKDSGVLIPDSDMDIYMWIGGSISKMDKKIQNLYDELSVDDRDDMNDKMIDMFADKYNMEW